MLRALGLFSILFFSISAILAYYYVPSLIYQFALFFSLFLGLFSGIFAVIHGMRVSKGQKQTIFMILFGLILFCLVMLFILVIYFSHTALQ